MLIEGGGRSGLGAAYSTREPKHLLNVRAEAMSAWADDSDDFARDFAEQGGDPRGFAERRLFGRYVRGILDRAVASGNVELIDGRAMKATLAGGCWEIELQDGDAIAADALVLAIGNQAPEPLPFAPGDSERFVANPWSEEARAAVEQVAQSGGSVLIVGTGLTMVDMVLSLDAAGHRGRIVALSRRGLVPRSHADFSAASVAHDEVPHGSVRSVWRWLREHSIRVGWRAAVDSLRPYSQRLWQSLTPEQQRRFLRHARPWWDVHRHRIAPEVAARIRDLVAEGRLEIVAGRIVMMRAEDGGLDVEFRRRVSARSSDQLRANERLRVDYAFNCTGPLGSIGRTTDPLLAQMLADGAIRADELGIGLDVDEHSRAAGAQRLWALGPLTKGRFWEIVAVPDIRVQAAAVAEDIAKDLGR